MPKGAAALLIHLASTNVQFTSEAKEAVSDNEEVYDEIRKGLLEVGRGLKNHLKKKDQRKKAKEKFELVNDILPAIAEKTSKILGREKPDLAPVITKIMNAVFCEEELGWDKERKLATCSIKVFNYTARARAYTILLKWPENDSVSIVENSNGGRKEARGIWAWRLDTLNPGSSTTITIALSGLSKGDWSDADVFYRGSGDIIGATKIDEKILEEIRKTEALSAVRKEISEINEIIYEDDEDIFSEVTDEKINPEIVDIFSNFEEEKI